MLSSRAKQNFFNIQQIVKMYRTKVRHFFTKMSSYTKSKSSENVADGLPPTDKYIQQYVKVIYIYTQKPKIPLLDKIKF